MSYQTEKPQFNARNKNLMKRYECNHNNFANNDIHIYKQKT